MFKGKVLSTHHATDTTWSKRIALITQHARIGTPNLPGILEIITNWPEGENFSLTDEEEQEQVTRAEEGPPYNQLPAEETHYALSPDGSLSHRMDEPEVESSCMEPHTRGYTSH
ncbi:hypothetical protein DUI87_11286 [Hirundo rustica rustica]|uniref:Uncharacterized protein n=1 Tax=Hirundo rustica rustica TaxID=333673 RepID=A0A3M0KHR6_HIRRU|nr:hypothetical protein DUI87_11286 [Hirundo rustica rustica]